MEQRPWIQALAALPPNTLAAVEMAGEDHVVATVSCDRGDFGVMADQRMQSILAGSRLWTGVQVKRSTVRVAKHNRSVRKPLAAANHDGLVHGFDSECHIVIANHGNGWTDFRDRSDEITQHGGTVATIDQVASQQHSVRQFAANDRGDVVGQVAAALGQMQVAGIEQTPRFLATALLADVLTPDQ